MYSGAAACGNFSCVSACSSAALGWGPVAKCFEQHAGTRELQAQQVKSLSLQLSRVAGAERGDMSFIQHSELVATLVEQLVALRLQVMDTCRPFACELQLSIAAARTLQQAGAPSVTAYSAHTWLSGLGSAEHRF